MCDLQIVEILEEENFEEIEVEYIRAETEDSEVVEYYDPNWDSTGEML